MVDVRNKEKRDAWLLTQDFGTQAILASRSALRVLPAITHSKIHAGELNEQGILSVLHLLSSARTRCFLLALDPLETDFQPASSGFLSTEYAAGDFAAFSAFCAFEFTTLDFETTSNMSLSRRAISNAASASDHSDEFFTSLKKDVEHIVSSKENIALLREPIWHRHGQQEPYKSLWNALSENLLSLDPNWSVWTDWYNEILSGNAEFHRDIDIGNPDTGQYGRCTFPDDYYNDPRKLNAALKDIIDRHNANKKLLDYNPEGGPATAHNQRTIFIKPGSDTPDTDYKAASDPQTQQLFIEVLRKIKVLQKACVGLGDNHGWDEIEDAVDLYVSTLGEDCADVPKTILLLHSRTIEIASFIEENKLRMQTPLVNQGQLPANAARALSSFIMTAGPWVRRFPSALKQDEEIDNFLARPSLYQPAKDILVAAGEASLLSEADRQLLNNLLDALMRPDPLSQKAGKHGQRGVRNVVVTGLSVLVGFYAGAVGSAVAEESIIAQRVAEVVTTQEAAVLEIMKDAPDDIREATKEIIRLTKEKRDTPEKPEKSLATSREEESDTP